MLSVGALIWISFRPLLRLAICAGAGFVITKADIFPPVAARGAGQIMLNITIPALMFSTIVPAFSSDNIHVLGPLVAIAFMYHLIGLFLAWVIQQFFWVPHRFRYGILAAGIFGNVGDIPTSVLLSITGAAPFNGSKDQTLAVAYISAFILVFVLCLFPFGGHNLIAQDFKGPDYETGEVRDAMRIKRKNLISNSSRALSRLLRRKPAPNPHTCEVENTPNVEEATRPQTISRPSDMASRHVSFFDEVESGVAAQLAYPSTSRAPTEILQSRLTSPTATVIGRQSTNDPLSRPLSPHTEMSFSNMTKENSGETKTEKLKGHHSRRLAQLRSILSSLLMPSSFTILISFPIAIISPLKSLFIQVEGSSIPNAPDGEPPLAFFMDAAQFIGAASVPLGLISLGSALARLEIPRGLWHSLPSGSIVALAVARMLILPVLGTAICEALIRINFISREDKVLQLVCIILSCLPTATTQVTLTQVYSGTGEAEHLAPFLIPQYLMMFVCMPGLIFYALRNIF